jgi:tetratricopeptide (TPR) repeat protein
MRRICQAALLAAVLLVGCSERGPAPAPPAPDAGKARQVAVGAQPPAGPPGAGAEAPVPAPSLPEPGKQDLYEAALLEALDFLADKKYAEALAALEKAQKLLDSGQVQREIDKVRGLMAQEAAAEKATQNIRTVLQDGNPAEAAKLANDALAQHGAAPGQAPEELARLKREADAVVTASAGDPAARRARLRADAEAALKDRNLRGAAVAYEQALALADDADLRKQYDDVRARLVNYDDLRARAARLRKDPGSLEDAVGLLKEAATAWDTPQVRLEIDECNLALQLRRERVSVADFEVRGDVGAPAAGASVAEELLPHFRPRFDLVERGQLGKLLGELKLEASDLTDSPTGRGELARLARVRYLVVGSLTPLNGVTLNARLVDVRTGLIAQTARLSAPTLEALLPRLKEVALMLQMTDEQKLAYESRLAASVAVVQPIEVPAELPPPPVLVVAAPPPALLITYTPRPAPLGGLVVEDFNRLPPVLVVEAPPPPPPPLVLVVRREDPRRQRLLALQLELGDNLYRRGRHREAHRHFQLALSLSDGAAAVQLRIDNCQPYLPPPPPPPVVVVVPPPPPRPRLAVFGFVVNAQPGLVPPATGDWAADHFASYFGGGYELIDRGEVCWYMGRLGITMRDVLNDPVARRCLAQALNARFFVFGAVVQTNSFNVSTHLLDAESGARTGTGTIHVQDHAELKLRMHELAKQVGAPVKEQAQLAKQGAATEKVLNEARRLLKAGQYAKAAETARAGLKAAPGNVALQSLQAEAEGKAKQAELEAQRRREAGERAAALAAAQKRQKELDRQAAEARARAEREARSRTDAEWRAQEASKQRAAEQLRAQAKQALAGGNPALAVQALQSAVALKPSDEAFRELAQARAAQEKAATDRAAAEKTKRDEDQARQRQAAAARVKAEQERRAGEDLARRKAQEARDQAAYDAQVKQARGLLAKKQYDQALALAQAARRLKATPESADLVRQAQEGQALAAAEKKGAAARAEAERRLAEERKKREAADAAAKRNQDAYLGALKEAQKAVAEKRYDQAVAHYQSALKLFRTDAALTGLKQAEDLRDRDRAAQDAARKRASDEAQRVARVKALVGEGQKALAAKQFDKAVAAYQEAKRLAPADVEVLAGLSRAERERDAWSAKNREAADLAKRQAEAKRKADEAAKVEEARRNAEFARLTSQGQAALTAKRYAEAVAAYQAALKLKPADAGAAKALREAQQALEAPKKAPLPPPVDPAKQRKAAYDKAMNDGGAALKARNYPGAVSAFQEALRLMPGDREAAAQRDQAQRLWQQALADEKRRAEEARLNAEFGRLMAQGQAALTAKRYAEAVAAYQGAVKLKPADAATAKALREAQQALEASRKPAPPPPPPPPPPVPPAVEHARQMQAGAAFEKQGKYAEAAAAYQAALMQVPGEARATAALRNALFQLHMANGRSAHAARRFADAVKSYEEALKLQPANAEAKDRLARAKAGRP